MYGKKRIVITKDGSIVLAGDKTWHPIGRYNKQDSKANFLKNDYQWERQLNNDNSLTVIGSITEIKKEVQKQYPIN